MSKTTSVPSIDSTLGSRDLGELNRRGITPEEVQWQYEVLLDPPAALDLVRPATVGDGIMRLSPEDERRLDQRGKDVAARGEVTKFVPASGAATRMFADLAAALDEPDLLEGSEVERFVAELDRFPFAPQLKRVVERGEDRESRESRRLLLATLLRRDGLGYGSLPKGLIPFHSYEEEARTAVAEHVREGVLHACDESRILRMHLTVTESARDSFAAEVRHEAEALGVEVDLTLSVQDPATDTIAIGEDRRIFRDENGNLLWRPGGHGALLRNLAMIETPYVSIKNVDNVRPDKHHAELARWKRMLVGVVDEIREQLLELWPAVKRNDPAGVEAAIRVVERLFGRTARPGIDSQQFALEALDRPLRVCGVVRNEGEPGGAPFWVRRQNEETVQIVESAQVDMSNERQKKVFGSSTHFNPVDIAASIQDPEGRPYDLDRFVDREAVFVSSKTYLGQPVRAIERPGLWNGAMAGWNTMCVEVPSFTFAPVKTIFDLLRPEHRS